MQLRPMLLRPLLMLLLLLLRVWMRLRDSMVGQSCAETACPVNERMDGKHHGQCSVVVAQ